MFLAVECREVYPGQIERAKEPAAALESKMEARLAAILTASTAFAVLFIVFASLLEVQAEAAAASLFP